MSNCPNRSGNRTRSFRLLLGLLLLLPIGCASTGPNQETEKRTAKARSHMNLGIDYLRTQRVELGLREFLIAETLDPKNARIQYAIGDAYLLKSKYEDAELHYRNTIALSPDFHDARLNLSGLLLGSERYEEARVESDILADSATFPAPWRALANRGWAEYKLGRTDQARATLELARDFSPSYWPSLLSLGILDMEQGQRLEAVSRFLEVLESRPDPNAAAEANYRIGEIYVALGNRERAVSHLMAAVASAPGGQWSTKSEEYLQLLR
jgi:type IV pilus assembly protein PilF